MVSINGVHELDQQMIGDIYTSQEVLENLMVLCDDFGSRFAGTPDELKAAEFIAEKMREYGLRNAHLESFPIEGWTRGPATLTIIEPIVRSLNCISLPFSKSFDIEGDLVNMGRGTPAEYEEAKDSLKGKFAMVSNRNPKGFGRPIHRMEKFGRAVVSGASGFIWVNETPSVGPETGCLTNPAAIPGVSVGLEERAFLVRLLQRHGRVRLKLSTTDQCEPKMSQNVVADLSGGKLQDTMVIIGSHYDSHDTAPGAVDSASGVVAIMEAARVLSRYATDRLGCTIRFVAFSCEEMGMMGSQQYVEMHREELDSLRMFLNFDAAGAIAGKKGIMLYHWPELENLFWDIGTEIGVSSVIQQLYAYADSFSFFIEGLPAGSLVKADETFARGVGHTYYDTVEKVGLDSLRDVSAIIARLALRVANMESFPARRRSKESIQEIFDTSPAFEGNRFLAANLGLT